MKKAFICFFMFLFVVYFVSIGTLLLWKLITGSGESVNIIITSSAIYSVILLALFTWRRWAALSPSWFRTADKSVLLWAGISAIGTILPFIWMQELLPELDESLAATFHKVAHAPLGYIVLCLFAPFIEEMVFRGAILRSLLSGKMNPWVAISVSAALFAVAHGNLSQMPHAFITGILLGWMYLRTGSILPGVAFHWVNNTICYAGIIIAPGLETMTLKQVFGSDLHVGLAVLCSFCIMLPALYQLHLRMKR